MRPLGDVQHHWRRRDGRPDKQWCIVAKKKRAIPVYRRCPICKIGVGTCVSTRTKSATLGIRYYVCADCGRSWTAKLKGGIIVSIHYAVDDSRSWTDADGNIVTQRFVDGRWV